MRQVAPVIEEKVDHFLLKLEQMMEAGSGATKDATDAATKTAATDAAAEKCAATENDAAKTTPSPTNEFEAAAAMIDWPREGEKEEEEKEEKGREEEVEEERETGVEKEEKKEEAEAEEKGIDIYHMYQCLTLDVIAQTGESKSLL